MSELTQMEHSTATGCTFVILSGERSEESKDPYGREQSLIRNIEILPL
jgi:hypothetical protein